MSVLKITKENFEEIKNSGKTVLIDFYADWCGPCRMVAPIIESIAEEYSEYTVGKINVDDQPDLAMMFQVSSIPTLVVLKDGKILNRAVGVKTRDQILDMLG